MERHRAVLDTDPDQQGDKSALEPIPGQWVDGTPVNLEQFPDHVARNRGSAAKHAWFIDSTGGPSTRGPGNKPRRYIVDAVSHNMPVYLTVKISSYAQRLDSAAFTQTEATELPITGQTLLLYPTAKCPREIRQALHQRSRGTAPFKAKVENTFEAKRGSVCVQVGWLPAH